MSHKNTQLVLNFEAGLTTAYQSCLEYVAARVHQLGKPQKAIAADMDYSPSDLSRKLSNNPSDPRTFSLNDLEKYVEVTGDTKPILYLVEKYLSESDRDLLERQIQELQARLADKKR